MILRNIYEEISDFGNYENESRSKEIQKDDVLGLLKRFNIDLRTIYKTNPVWRGKYNSFDKYYYIDPSQHERVSRNTDNFYTLLLDNLESWKQYPKRSKSLICSLNSDHASSMAGGEEPYLVVPLEKSPRFGICPEEDIWISFKVFNDDDGGMLDDFTDFLSRVGGMLDVRYAESYKDLTALFVNMEKHKDHIFDNMENDGVMSIYREAMISKIWERSSKSFYEIIKHIFAPEYNDFKVTTFPSQLLKAADNEVWTDSKSILIIQSEVENLLGSIM